MDFAPLKGTLVLGVGHKARQGKDAAASFLVKTVNATRFAFADALYAYCRVEHGMTMKDAPLLQKIGVEMRNRDPLVWVKAVYWDILTKAPKTAVITDVRFPNEMAFIKAVGGYTCKVSRFDFAPYKDNPIVESVEYQAEDRDPNHISETALDDAKWDFHIAARSGDLASLHQEILDVYYRVIGVKWDEERHAK